MAIDFNQLAFAPGIAAFGQAVVYQPNAGPAIFLTGIFNEFATDEKVNSNGDIEQVTSPTLALNQRDLPTSITPKRNETLQVNGNTYQISEVLNGNFAELLLRLKNIS